MDLSMEYLGLKLRTPLVPAASPLSEELDNIKRMEDAGAAAIVMHSLFEEQLKSEDESVYRNSLIHTDSFAEAQSFFPENQEFNVGPEEYLNHIRRAKEAVHIPIIASLNGVSLGAWTDFAKKIQQAGADAIELNIYQIPANIDAKPEKIEQDYFDILKAVKKTVKIPIAVKMSPYFTSLGYMAKKLDKLGASGLVLFNRFYQPDIDPEALEVRPDIILSNPHSLRLPLRWIAILYGRINASLAATSGIHRPEDVIKVVMAGASAAMICSALLRHGISYLRELESGIHSWLEEHEYESMEQMRGSMSQLQCENPVEFERVQYIKALQGFRSK